MNSHEIDYKIYGDDLQAVEIELDPQETSCAETAVKHIKDNRSDTSFFMKHKLLEI